MPFPRHKKFRRTSSLLPVCVRRTNQHIRLHLCCCFRGVDLRFSEAQNKLLVEIRINKITRKRRKVWTDSTVGWGVEVVEVGGCGGGGLFGNVRTHHMRTGGWRGWTQFATSQHIFISRRATDVRSARDRGNYALTGRFIRYTCPPHIMTSNAVRAFCPYKDNNTLFEKKLYVVLFWWELCATGIILEENGLCHDSFRSIFSHTHTRNDG